MGSLLGWITALVVVVGMLVWFGLVFLCAWLTGTLYLWLESSPGRPSQVAWVGWKDKRRGE